MTTGTQLKAGKDRARIFWHHKGSWILLALVGVSMFLAGNGFHSYMSQGTIKVLQDSFDRKEENYRERIRSLNDEIRTYLPKAAKAAETSDEVAKQVQQTKQSVETLTNKFEASEKGEANGKNNRETSGQ